MKRLILITLFIAAAANCNRVAAQYYTTGQTPASQRWKTLGSDSLRMVYPEGFDAQARRTLFYMEKAHPYVNHGFLKQPLRTPVVFKTENFLSNGLSILAPKRIEIVGIPSIETYSEPWLKQLATHEYRHMVQYANVNRSTVKVLSWFLGQQAPLVATGLVPFWFIEGDAVMFETQMSTFGRGLQPSFTMHYRALGDEILQRGNPDKWFCGSYRDYVPSHYELGFQMVAFADTKYDTYIGESITRYTANFPILIFTAELGLHKYHHTSERKLFRETFTSLNALWASLPQTENSAKVVSPPVKRYTTYSYPLFLNDSTLLVLKKDLDRTSRFVEIDIPSGTERTLCYTGPVNSRPTLKDGRVMWTEYRQSMFWEQKVDSRVCAMNVGEWKNRQVKNYGNSALYPTDMGRGLTACVTYHYDGHYSIDIYAPSREGAATGTHILKSIKFPKSVSLHGLAWDPSTSALYYIGLSDDGMWIGGIRKPESAADRFDVKAPAYVTLGDLSAADGMLYFNSIYSGTDEVHTIDLTSNGEYRISQSRYGTFSASPSPKGDYVAVTTYDRTGYKAAVQEVEYWDEVEWRATPYNIVNPPLKKWDVTSIDDAIFSPAEEERSGRQYPSKKYHKATHLFNVHSWAPFYFKPDELMSDDSFDFNIGATAISQNILSSAVSSLGYGYSQDGHSTVRGQFGYYGWAPKIDVTALWSDRPHQVIDLQHPATPTHRGSSFSMNAKISLPMLLSSGYRIRSLTPLIQYNFNNGEIVTAAGGTERRSTTLGSVQYSESVRRTVLDLQPRWGYALRTSIAGNPFSSLYSTAWSAYGRLYTPGLFLHHGFTFAAAYQQASENKFMIGVIDFQPRGFNTVIYPDRYFAAAASYKLPIAYPDFGISGLLFFKRISMEVGYEYANYTQTASAKLFDSTSTAINTYGGTLYFDIAPLRMPDESTCTLSVGIYKPSGRDVYVKVGFSVPL